MDTSEEIRHSVKASRRHSVYVKVIKDSGDFERIHMSRELVQLLAREPKSENGKSDYSDSPIIKKARLSKVKILGRSVDEEIWSVNPNKERTHGDQTKGYNIKQDLVKEKAPLKELHQKVFPQHQNNSSLVRKTDLRRRRYHHVAKPSKHKNSQRLNTKPAQHNTKKTRDSPRYAGNLRSSGKKQPQTSQAHSNHNFNLLMCAAAMSTRQDDTNLLNPEARRSSLSGSAEFPASGSPRKRRRIISKTCSVASCCDMNSLEKKLCKSSISSQSNGRDPAGRQLVHLCQRHCDPQESDAVTALLSLGNCQPVEPCAHCVSVRSKVSEVLTPAVCEFAQRFPVPISSHLSYQPKVSAVPAELMRGKTASHIQAIPQQGNVKQAFVRRKALAKSSSKSGKWVWGNNAKADAGLDMGVRVIAREKGPPFPTSQPPMWSDMTAVTNNFTGLSRPSSFTMYQDSLASLKNGVNNVIPSEGAAVMTSGSFVRGVGLSGGISIARNVTSFSSCVARSGMPSDGSSAMRSVALVGSNSVATSVMLSGGNNVARKIMPLNSTSVSRRIIPSGGQDVTLSGGTTIVSTTVAKNIALSGGSNIARVVTLPSGTSITRNVTLSGRTNVARIITVTGGTILSKNASPSGVSNVVRSDMPYDSSRVIESISVEKQSIDNAVNVDIEKQNTAATENIPGRNKESIKIKRKERQYGPDRIQKVTRGDGRASKVSDEQQRNAGINLQEKDESDKMYLASTVGHMIRRVGEGANGDGVYELQEDAFSLTKSVDSLESSDVSRSAITSECNSVQYSESRHRVIAEYLMAGRNRSKDSENINTKLDEQPSNDRNECNISEVSENASISGKEGKTSDGHETLCTKDYVSFEDKYMDNLDKENNRGELPPSTGVGVEEIEQATRNLDVCVSMVDYPSTPVGLEEIVASDPDTPMSDFIPVGTATSRPSAWRYNGGIESGSDKSIYAQTESSPADLSETVMSPLDMTIPCRDEEQSRVNKPPLEESVESPWTVAALTPRTSPLPGSAPLSDEESKMSTADVPGASFPSYICLSRSNSVPMNGYEQHGGQQKKERVSKVINMDMTELPTSDADLPISQRDQCLTQLTNQTVLDSFKSGASKVYIVVNTVKSESSRLPEQWPLDQEEPHDQLLQHLHQQPHQPVQQRQQQPEDVPDVERNDLAKKDIEEKKVVVEVIEGERDLYKENKPCLSTIDNVDSLTSAGLWSDSDDVSFVPEIPSPLLPPLTDEIDPSKAASTVVYNSVDDGLTMNISSYITPVTVTTTITTPVTVTSITTTPVMVTTTTTITSSITSGSVTTDSVLPHIIAPSSISPMSITLSQASSHPSQEAAQPVVSISCSLPLSLQTSFPRTSSCVLLSSKSSQLSTSSLPSLTTSSLSSKSSWRPKTPTCQVRIVDENEMKASQKKGRSLLKPDLLQAQAAQKLQSYGSDQDLLQTQTGTNPQREDCPRNGDTGNSTQNSHDGQLRESGYLNVITNQAARMREPAEDTGEKKPPDQWTSCDIIAWLGDHNLTQFAPVFETMDGGKLLDLKRLQTVKPREFFEHMNALELPFLDVIRFSRFLRQLTE